MSHAKVAAATERDLEAIWLPLLKTDGQWDEQKICNELHDLLFVYKQVAEVYCYITGNKLSKPMYYADTIKAAFDDAVQDAVDEALRLR